MARETRAAFAHEILHLYGARGLYAYEGADEEIFERIIQEVVRKTALVLTVVRRP